MKKKFFISALAIILCVFVFSSIINIEAVTESTSMTEEKASSEIGDQLSDSDSAETVDSTQTTDRLYYSDLFYGYDSSYLYDESILKLHIKDTSIILQEIYNDYADSDKFMWTNIKSSLAAATNIKEWVSLVASVNGETEYNYEKALDKANQKFVEELMGRNISSDLFGSGAEIVTRYKKLVDVFNKFEQNFDVYQMTEYEIYYEFFAILKDERVFAYIGSVNVTKIEEVVLSDVSGYTKFLSNTGNALKAAQVLSIGLMLEDARLEIIDEVIANSPTDSTIYDGMSRLNSQLKNGFVSYFCSQYIEEGLLKKFGETIVEKIIKSSSSATFAWYEVVTAGVDLASMIIFDVVFDIPSVDDMTVQRVLTAYSSDLYDLTKVKISAFDKQFNSNDISKLEYVFDAYVAATNAALKASQKLELDSNKDDLFVVTTVWEDFCYSQYIRNVIEGIEQEAVIDRKIKSFEKWNNPGGIFRAASDEIEDDSVYLFNGVLNANVNYTKTTTIKSEGNISPVIKGNVIISSSSETTVTVPSDEEIIIDGDLTVQSYARDIWGETHTYLKNEGTLKCLGNVEFVRYTPEYYSSAYGYYIDSDSSRLIIDKNLTKIYYYGTPAGTIEFAGTEQQEVYLPKAYNVEVTNPNGIKYLCSLNMYGKYNLNGNPLDLNGFYTYMCGNDSELDGSDFQEVRIIGDHILDYNIKGNVTIYGELSSITVKVTIPEGSNVTIDGNLKVSMIIKGIAGYRKVHLINKGTLTCTNDLTFIGDNNDDNFGYYESTMESRLIVKGDINAWTGTFVSTPAGTIELSGTEQQTVTYLKTHNLTVNNPNGIKYLSTVYLYGHYALNGNPLDSNGFYTYMYPGATFDDISEYGKVSVQGNVILSSNINADVDVGTFTLTIPEGRAYCISGNVTINKSSSRNGSIVINNKSDLTIDGNVTINGSLNILEEASLTVGGNISINEAARLSNRGGLNIKGNFKSYEYNCCIVGGNAAIVFSGKEAQEVSNLWATVIILENQSDAGVVFTNAVKSSVLFEHNGNNFTLCNNGSGSSFVDYDGDGIKDNLDLQPMVYNENQDELSDSEHLHLVESKDPCTEDIYCIVCYAQISSAGHALSDAATCTRDQVCLVCGEILVPALGHHYSIVVTEPTCTEQGYTTYTCGICGDVVVDSYIDAHGHTEGDWVTLENGDRELRCTVCETLLDFEQNVPVIDYDVNGDGKFNMFDYINVKNICLKGSADEALVSRADINGDGRLNMFDYITVKSEYFRQSAS